MESPDPNRPLDSKDALELAAFRRKQRRTLVVCLIICIAALPIGILVDNGLTVVLSVLGIIVSLWKLSRWR